MSCSCRICCRFTQNVTQSAGKLFIADSKNKPSSPHYVFQKTVVFFCASSEFSLHLHPSSFIKISCGNQATTNQFLSPQVFLNIALTGWNLCLPQLDSKIWKEEEEKRRKRRTGKILRGFLGYIVIYLYFSSRNLCGASKRTVESAWSLDIKTATFLNNNNLTTIKIINTLFQEKNAFCLVYQPWSATSLNENLNKKP